MMARLELEVQVHSFLTSELGGEWQPSHFDRLIVARVSHSVGGLVAYNIKYKWDNQAKKTEWTEGVGGEG
jgi:hypothetical protein